MKFEKYHFHIYFQETEIEKAQALINELKQFDYIEIGRLRERPIGPHPIGSCQISIKSKDFYLMTEWFLINRKGLSIFIHAVTGDDLIDHSEYVMWIGESYKLNLDFFK